MSAKCRFARAAIESARTGISHIRETEPHQYLALFLALGLVTNTRAVFHALRNADKKASDVHARAIDEWEKSPPYELARFNHVVRPVRDQLIKEWSIEPVIATLRTSGTTSDYTMALYLPRTDQIDTVTTEEEMEERDSAIRFAIAIGEDTEGIDREFRIDVLAECEAALSVWEGQISIIEERIEALSSGGD